MGVGDAGHGVGDAGPGGDQRDAEAAGQLGVRVGHVHGRPLVAHVHDADALGVGAHPQRHDVTAAEREDAVHAASLEEASRHSGGGVGGRTGWVHRRS